MQMTEQEAIQELKYDCEQLGKAIPCDTSWGQAIETAYGMAISALEKQIPKNPIKIQTSPKRFYYACPICENRQDRQEKHCYECGQSLDWSKE